MKFCLENWKNFSYVKLKKKKEKNGCDSWFSQMSDLYHFRNLKLMVLRIMAQNVILGKFKEMTSNCLTLCEPHREKTGFLPRRKQRRRSASR